MGTSRHRKHYLEYGNGPIAWTLREYDDFSIRRATLTFDAPPATIENIKIWHKSSENSDYDCVIRNLDPNGLKYISFEEICGFESGDFAYIEYPNTLGIGVRGIAILEI